VNCELYSAELIRLVVPNFPNMEGVVGVWCGGWWGDQSQKRKSLLSQMACKITFISSSFLSYETMIKQYIMLALQQ